MKYYISKPASHKIDTSIIAGVKSIDTEAIFVKELCDADIAIFQKGWPKSQICVSEHHLARDKHIKCKEAYLYTDRYVVRPT